MFCRQKHCQDSPHGGAYDHGGEAGCGGRSCAGEHPGVAGALCLETMLC